MALPGSPPPEARPFAPRAADLTTAVLVQPFPAGGPPGIGPLRPLRFAGTRWAHEPRLLLRRMRSGTRFRGHACVPGGNQAPLPDSRRGLTRFARLTHSGHT